MVFGSLHTFEKKTNENDLNKYTIWINLRPMYIKDNISKGSKINHHLYILQEVKANYFLKLNMIKEDLTKIFIDEIFSKPPRKIIQPIK